MSRTRVPSPHHELSLDGMAPWPLDAIVDMSDVQADPAARCCRECGRRLLLLLLRSSSWVSHRTEHVSFRDDRSVVREVTVEFHVPEQAPVFRGDDRQAYNLVPVSVMRRKTIVNFRLHDDDGRSVTLPSLRQNQAITESVLLACADATIERPRSKTRAGAGSNRAVAKFVHQVVSGDQRELTTAYETLERGTAAPVVLDLAGQRMFRAILNRLADNFVLWVMIPAGAPRRRVITFSCDEPLHLYYREPGFKDNEYRLGTKLKPWRPIVWASAFGLIPTRIRFPVPAAENTASFHFEIDAPPGVQIAEASLLAGRPGEKNPSLDLVQGGFPTVGLHVIEVPTGSLSRAQVGLQVVTRGWVMSSTFSAWAVFGLLLAFATHDTVLKRLNDVPAVILVGLATGIVAIVAQSDAHGLAAHLLKWARALVTITVVLPLVATTFIVFGLVHPSHVPPALWTGVGVSGAIALLLSAVCLTPWWRRWRQQVKPVLSPWEQSHKRMDKPSRPEDFEKAAREHHYDKPAMRVDTAEGWHREFLWAKEAEEHLIDALQDQQSAHHVPASPNGLPYRWPNKSNRIKSANGARTSTKAG
jgi:hypothetical protein